MHCIIPSDRFPFHTGETVLFGVSLCDMHLEFAWSVWDEAVIAGNWETMSQPQFLNRLLKKVTDA